MISRLPACARRDGEYAADELGGDAPEWVAVPIAFAVVTNLSVVFGGLVPTALTLDRAEKPGARPAATGRSIAEFRTFKTPSRRRARRANEPPVERKSAQTIRRPRVHSESLRE